MWTVVFHCYWPAPEENVRRYPTKQRAMLAAQSYVLGAQPRQEAWADIRNRRNERVMHYFVSDGRLNYVDY